MRSDSDLHEPRTDAEQSETGGAVRVSYESEPVVYFVGAPNGLVKIGFASDFDARFGALVCASPVPLQLLAIVLGAGRVLEGKYHARFKAWRRHGEWFERCPEIEAEIARLNAHPLSRSHP